MQQIKGLYETHLHVQDLDRSIDFYANTLELEQCYYEEGRRAAFFWIGQPRQFMLGLWEKPVQAITRMHFAFQCEPDWVLNESVDFLKNRGLACRNFLSDGTERPMVFAWMPAISIYFDDPDDHSLEFIGVLEGKSRPEAGVLSYEQWLALESKER
ncbi:MAG: VOC family protein [Saprospiraceae bacterium]|nr:VOC family protein [Saprospiraceae bacterium]